MKNKDCEDTEYLDSLFYLFEYRDQENGALRQVLGQSGCIFVQT